MRWIAALILFSCGRESTPLDPSEYARGLELLEAQSINPPPMRVYVEPVVVLDEEEVGGYVLNYYHAAILIAEHETGCLGHTALNHEAAHIALYREQQWPDPNHEQEAVWNAVRTANAIWRAEACTE